LRTQTQEKAGNWLNTLFNVLTNTEIDNLSIYFFKNYFSMTEERITEMMSRIDDYVRGRLVQEQIEDLWIEFLKDPYWFKIAEVEVILRNMIMQVVVIQR